MEADNYNNKTEVPVDEDIATLVPNFIKSRNSDINNLKKLIEHNQFSEMAKIAHTIKGIARPYGFPFLEQMARELETACASSDTRSAEASLSQIEKYLKLYY